MSSITLSGISKSFDDLQALSDVTVEVEDGSFFVLLGPSGAGKTTTLRIIAGLETPDTGTVSFDGHDAAEATPAARDVAMVFQTYALYPKQTVAQNIASPLRARQLGSDEIEKRVNEVAEILHITKLLERKPQQLSGGEQQRVALGRALVREPRAFLMDEPLTNLDVKLRVEMRAELTRLHRRFGRTFFYVSNDQAEAMSMADKVGILNDGRLQQVGTPEEVYDRPVNRFVATFIGSSRMNLLPCRREGGRLIGAAGWELPAPGAVGAARDEQDLEFGIRPEDMVVDGSRSDLPTIDGTVYAVEPLGDRSLIDVEVGDTIIRVKAPPAMNPPLDSVISVGVDLDRAHLFDAASGDALAHEGAQDAVTAG